MPAMSGGGFQSRWRGRELLGAMNRAQAVTLTQAGNEAVKRMQAFAHVVTGEMKREMYAEAGITGDGHPTLVLGSFSDHLIWEMKRGGPHDPIHRVVDTMSRSIRSRLQANIRAQGW